MSTFSCPLVKIGEYRKHPNADTLNIVEVEGSTCIFKDGAFVTGDWAVFTPIEALVPLAHPAFSWLVDPKRPAKTHYRVKAKRLRGVFSDGFLTPAHELLDSLVVLSMNEGDDCSQLLNITKAVDELPIYMGSDSEPGPDGVPVYDMEPWRKYKRVFDQEYENVVITEKIHGTNSRFMHDGNRLWVASHRRFVCENEKSLWWGIARDYDLEHKLQGASGFVLFGEIYGVQDLRYDVVPGTVGFLAFDIYDTNSRRYLNWEEFHAFCSERCIPMVPVLYKGPLGDGSVVESLTNPIDGDLPYKSTLAECLREGVVVKPMVERWNQYTHRTILKSVSIGYLLRKNGTEAQ